MPRRSDPEDEEETEGDLWFLPPDPQVDPALPPLPRPSATLGALDLRDWRRAQGDLAGELAHLAARFGALDERLRGLGDGMRHRLALIEASELSWWCGDRIPADRLALWLGLRLAGVQEDSLALARAAWAARRLSGGPGPETGRSGAPVQALADFLDRHEAPAADETLTGRLSDWLAVMGEAEDLHPIVRAAYAYHLWGMGQVSGPGAHPGQDAATGLEAAVVAARIGASAGRGPGGAVFLPLATSGAGALRGGGPPVDRLARWLSGAEQATLAALLHLDRIAEWQGRAAERLDGLQGRTPPRLIRLFAEWPHVSAPLAEQGSGASRAAVQRNLDRMTDLGLIREVTGQGRYRIWTARLQV